MNDITLRGIIKNIENSHSIDGIAFDKALLIVKREDGKEDILNLRFKSFTNRYLENDYVELKGNIRSYSYKLDEEHNKVLIYVFTYFDKPEELDGPTNTAIVDGRICKMNDIRLTRNGRHNIHFILANNLISNSGTKRLNSYIPCIAWGRTAKDISKLNVNSQVKLFGKLHSREHKKIHSNGEIEIRVAHEFVVESFEVL